MSDETTGCADDGDELSQALRKIAPERLNELLREELPDAHKEFDVLTQAAQQLKREAVGGTFTMSLHSGIVTEPIAFDATEAEMQAAVDAAIAKHKLQMLQDEIIKREFEQQAVADGRLLDYELQCACGSKETVIVNSAMDLYRVLNEKGYGLIPTQHGRIVQVVCPDCRPRYDAEQCEKLERQKYGSPYRNRD